MCIYNFAENHKSRHCKYQDDPAEVDVEALNIYSMFFILVNCSPSTDGLCNFNPDLLEDIIHLLEPFDEATRHLSTDQTPSLHLVLPTKETLLRGLLLQDGDSVNVKEIHH
ncbi:zinc finger protein 1035 isoform X3 [Tachysurus fulvidraco]|uniref:zinc finger protein 1035 isoform X3 n=1 Tax=Tachysurus fulvidraco TaxID=1234273 RepID=UPI001FEED07D|nr:zinc finger protein 1035 isoform X3 [Tachysurus fulvidraco]